MHPVVVLLVPNRTLFQKVQQPKIHGCFEGCGFNIFLTEVKDDIYGRWQILKNNNSVWNEGKRLPEPFPFEFNEFERELEVLGAAHIYVSEITPFNLESILDLIKMCI